MSDKLKHTVEQANARRRSMCNGAVALGGAVLAAPAYAAAGIRRMGRLVVRISAVTVVCAAMSLGHAERSFGKDLIKVELGAMAESTIEVDASRKSPRAHFSTSELDSLLRSEVQMDAYYCGCGDTPRRHFPYSFAVLKTLKGDLLVRAEGTDGVLKFTPMAIRYGDEYCPMETEDSCFGSFEHPCDFTDFRYGRTLAPYFPTCKAD